MDITITVTDIPRFDMSEVLSDLSYKTAEEIEKYTSKYAPLSEANNPTNPRGYWYERGYGWRGIIDKPVSEQLGSRWSIDQQGDTSVITNTASYARYVHSNKEQLFIHKKRGWRNDRDGIEHVKPMLDSILNDALKDFW